MRKWLKRRRMVALLLFFACLVNCFYLERPRQANAAVHFITRGEMVQQILTELRIPNNSSDYKDKALKIGLVTKATFKDYNLYLTKYEAAVLLVRADEYLYGKKVKDELVTEIIKYRISDLKSIRKVYHTYVAKAYALGYIKGYSNGLYSTNRKLGLKSKVSTKYADYLINLIRNTKGRAKVSPDGQLLRTTKLPKMAEFYPYILASYPNSYYDWQFLFMRARRGEEPNYTYLYGTDEYVNKKHYVTPVDFCDYKFGEKVLPLYNKENVNAATIYKECSNKWEQNARDYLECIFNVNYKTIKNDKKWLDKIISADYQGVMANEGTEKFYNHYIEDVLKNKTWIESKYIGVDKSSIYSAGGSYYIRAYVKFRVISAKDTSVKKGKSLLCTRDLWPDIKNIELNKWRDCYINIMVTPETPNYGVELLLLNDFYHDYWVVKLW